MWDASQFVTEYFVTKAIIALRNVTDENSPFISWLHITGLYTGDNCLNSVRKRQEFPVSVPVFSSLSLSSQHRRCLTKQRESTMA